MTDKYTTILQKLSTQDIKSVSSGDFTPICEGCKNDEAGQEGHMGECGCLGPHWGDDPDDWEKNKHLVMTDAQKILDQRPTGLTDLAMAEVVEHVKPFNRLKLRDTLKTRVTPEMASVLKTGYGIEIPPPRKLPAWLVKMNKQSGKKDQSR